jgi:hypothetical protein
MVRVCHTPLRLHKRIDTLSTLMEIVQGDLQAGTTVYDRLTRVQTTDALPAPWVCLGSKNHTL